MLSICIPVSLIPRRYRRRGYRTVSTATVSQDPDGNYVYEVNFLSVGDYTAAFTCQASDDDAGNDDEIVLSAPQMLLTVSPVPRFLRR